MTTDFAPGRATRTYDKPGIGKTPWPMSRVLRRFQVRVEEWARESGNDPEVATPAMMWFAGLDQLVVMQMILSSEPVDQLSGVAYGVVQGQLPLPEWVIYLAEGWAADDASRDTVLEPHELHDRHAIGMTGVYEAITGHMRARSGSGWDLHQRYRRVGSESLEWEPPYLPPEEAEQAGRVIRLLETMVGLQEWDGF